MTVAPTLVLLAASLPALDYRPDRVAVAAGGLDSSAADWRCAAPDDNGFHVTRPTE